MTLPYQDMPQRRWTQQYENEVVRWAWAVGRWNSSKQDMALGQRIKDFTWHGRYSWPLRAAHSVVSQWLGKDLLGNRAPSGRRPPGRA